MAQNGTPLSSKTWRDKNSILWGFLGACLVVGICLGMSKAHFANRRVVRMAPASEISKILANVPSAEGSQQGISAPKQIAPSDLSPKIK
jgi:hypothetical protein